MGEHKMLPCGGCGRELQGSGAEETTKFVETDRGVLDTFQGAPVGDELPALVCPDCGHVTAL